MEWLLWFSKPEHTKPLALVIFLVTFIGIVLYVYGNRQRGDRLESYRDMPFLDEDQTPGVHKDTKERP
ncbi:MAG: cbb3-type cytochrome c oxidase subunit 3 [Thiobacillaceae bacterium]